MAISDQEGNDLQLNKTGREIFGVKNLNIYYEGSQIIEDLNLSVSFGECIGIVGPSGSGKSSLLRAIYKLNPKSAFIHQDYCLTPQLSVYHNVYAGSLEQHSLFRNLFNLLYPYSEDLQKISDLLKKLNLADKLYNKVSELSGGQQQRVAIARALNRSSSVLLADEPVSALDPPLANQALEILKEKFSTTIFVMHDTRLSLKHFDRIVGLRTGRICFDLPSREVSKNLLQELFLPCSE